MRPARPEYGKIHERPADKAIGGANQFGDFDFIAPGQNLQADGVGAGQHQGNAQGRPSGMVNWWPRVTTVQLARQPASNWLVSTIGRPDSSFAAAQCFGFGVLGADDKRIRQRDCQPGRR